MKKYGTHICGHDGMAEVFGPTKDRQWKIDSFFARPCAACAEKERIEEIERNNKEMKLPDLTGSDKQINWANGLRLTWIASYNKYVGSLSNLAQIYYALVSAGWFEEHKNMDDAKAFMDSLFLEILSYAISTKTQSQYWIETRHDNIKKIILRFADDVMQNKKENLKSLEVE